MVARTSLGVDKALTRFAILNKNPEGVYIADMVLPKIGVMGRTGKLYTVNSGFRFASPSQGLKRLGGSAFKRFSMGVAQSDVYNLEEYGNGFPVDDIDAEFAGDDSVNLREAAAILAVEQFQIEREREAAALLFSGSVITQTAALGAGDRWDDAGVDPRANVETAVQTIQLATGLPRARVSLLVGQQVADKLVRNDALMQFFRAGNPGVTMASLPQVASAMGIREVIVGGAVANSAVEGQTASNGYIWGKSACFFYREESPIPMAPRGTGFTFHRSGYDLKVERYREEPRAEIVLASALEDRVITAANTAYLFTTAVN